jgi:hypothetical protein
MEERNDTIKCAVKLNLGFVFDKSQQLKDELKSGRKHTQCWKLDCRQIESGQDGRLLACVYRKEVDGKTYVVHLVDPYVYSMSDDRKSVVEFCRDFRHKIKLDSLTVEDSVVVSPDDGRIGSLLKDKFEHVQGVRSILDRYPWLTPQK